MRSTKKPETPLQRLKKTTSPKLVTIPKLVKSADEWFSRMVRLRDSEYKDGKWVCECITCGRRMTTVDAEGHWNKVVNAGHYISRGRKIVRWDETNVNAQCAHCNAWRDKKDMLTRYRKALRLKYGHEVPGDLEMLGKSEHKPTRQELELIIQDSKEFVTFTLVHPWGIE